MLIAPAADPVAAAERFADFDVARRGYLGRRMFAYFERRIGITFEEQQAHLNAPAIGRPALIVHDLEDRDVPWSEGERYARYWPDSRLLTTRGLGHSRMLDDGERDRRRRCASCAGKTSANAWCLSPNLPYGVA